MVKAPFAATILLAVLFGSVGGCGLFTKSEEEPVREVTSKEAPGRPPTSVGELDQVARNFSDRLVARLSTACDQIKREASDEDARKNAHELKLSIALAAYDIVSSPGGTRIPGAAQHVLDLAILTELHWVRWIQEHAARDAFGKRGEERLSEALATSREDIWQIAGRVMKPEQIDLLRTMILRWRQKNPNVEWLSRVRLDVIAQGKEGEGFTKSVGEGWNPVTSALREVDEARLFAEQALFYAKRAPMILDWTTEATASDTLAVPKVDRLVHGLTETMGSVSRATAVLEKLLEPSSEEPAINSTIEEARDALAQAKELIRELRGLEASVEPWLNKPKKDPAGKPLDINHVAEKADDVARETTSLVRETRALAESPSAIRNVDQVLDRTSRNLSETGHEIINLATLRAVELVILVAVLVVAIKTVTFWLRRRREPAKAL